METKIDREGGRERRKPRSSLALLEKGNLSFSTYSHTNMNTKTRIPTLSISLMKSEKGERRGEEKRDN